MLKAMRYDLFMDMNKAAIYCLPLQQIFPFNVRERQSDYEGNVASAHERRSGVREHWSAPDGAALNLSQRARILHKTAEPARQFMNAMILVAEDGLFGQQLRTDPNRRGSSKNVTGCVLLIDTAGGDQRNLRQGHLQRTDV